MRVSSVRWPIKGPHTQATWHCVLPSPGPWREVRARTIYHINKWCADTSIQLFNVIKWWNRHRLVFFNPLNYSCQPELFFRMTPQREYSETGAKIQRHKHGTVDICVCMFVFFIKSFPFFMKNTHTKKIWTIFVSAAVALVRIFALVESRDFHVCEGVL